MSNTVELAGSGASPGQKSLHAADDWREHRTAGVLIGLGAACVVGLVVLINLVHTGPRASAGMASSLMPGSTSSTTGSPAGMSAGGVTSGSGGVAMKGIPTVNGASLPVMSSTAAMPQAMAMVPLGQATWQGMKIVARTSAPATFEVYNGASQQTVTPTKSTSFHLMILLSDSTTGVAIPYSSVWATINKGSKVVYDERLWPMISRYMGPHYGNNITLPAAGTYHLTLLVSPPVAARHLEYKNLWLTPHRVHMTFRWVPKA
jgi:hypothetical protein